LRPVLLAVVFVLACPWRAAGYAKTASFVFKLKDSLTCHFYNDIQSKIKFIFFLNVGGFWFVGREQMKLLLIYVATWLLVIFMLLTLGGCAGEPLSFEQRQALMAAGVGLQNAGRSISESARWNQSVQVYPQYNPMYAPVFNPAPIY
jgi:hypothetical protein